MACDVVMLLENNPYEHDVRVRAEAESLAQDGWVVHVVAPRASGGGAPPRAPAGVTVERFSVPIAGKGVAGLLGEYLIAGVQLHVRGIRALLAGARVVHLHNPPDFLCPLGLVARAMGRRVVFDHHDLAPELVAERFHARALVQLALLAERLTFRTADAVLSPNESHREVALGRGGVPGDRVAVVRNGPPRRMLAAGAAPRRPGPLADPRIVFLGSMASQDGVAFLPDLLLRLRTRHGLPGAHLTLIGDGPAARGLRRAFAAAGLSGAVEFTGRVAHDRVPALLAEADICVDPAPATALNHRSTMVKVAEYLAAGRPVVAFDLLETRRTAGGAARLAAPGDFDGFARHVAELSRNEEARTSLGDRGRARAEALVWEHSEAALRSAYRGLLGAPSRRAGAVRPHPPVVPA